MVRHQRSKNTPSEIIDKLNKEVNAALADTKTKARLFDLGGIPLISSPADFRQAYREVTDKRGKVVRAVNLKPE
jgi:tripartite-type tricarboxylate transporter receptor subunit TctC